MKVGLLAAITALLHLLESFFFFFMFFTRRLENVLLSKTTLLKKKTGYDETGGTVFDNVQIDMQLC